MSGMLGHEVGERITDKMGKTLKASKVHWSLFYRQQGEDGWVRHSPCCRHCWPPSLLSAPTRMCDSALPAFIKGSRKKLKVCFLLPLLSTSEWEALRAAAGIIYRAGQNLLDLPLWKPGLLICSLQQAVMGDSDLRREEITLHFRWAHISTCIL